MPETRRYQIRGIVQGVGFRPFVWRTAARHALGGWVRNDSEGVVLEVQGPESALEEFIREVRTSAPALARIDSVALLEQRSIEVVVEEFEIHVSERQESARTLVSADTCVCEECLAEMLDPENRRYRYPFINCTNCGPRYSIIEGVPYDRALTTMSVFPMCEECTSEYHDVCDRRFHAQPVACWKCGPRVQLWHPQHGMVQTETPVLDTVQLLRAGAIVAVKGIGGYHLMVDARNEEAVAELRRRKRREEKPFAVMSPGIEAVSRYGEVQECEAELLSSLARPIVLVAKRNETELAPSIAPGNRRYGVMLAYAPLHHLLLEGELDALVATSGNVSDEPIAFTNEDALERLAPIADAFLINNRDIYTRVDDSIVRAVSVGGRTEVSPLRRARGYTPVPVEAPFEMPPVLAVGPELKNTICISRGMELFLSHHIGDLKNEATLRSFEHAIGHLAKLLEVTPEVVAHDMHPGYMSTRYAREQHELPTVEVQHHHAHMAACMCEHGLQEPVLGVIFDGTGYGIDGHIWGGEWLVGDYGGFERAAHIEYFRLPGGDRAVEQPFRTALSLLAQAHGGELGGELTGVPVVAARSEQERHVLARMVAAGISSPLTSSVGRLFDGVSALLGVREECRYEAQAAIELEQLIEPGTRAAPLAWELHADEAPLRVDARPMVRELAELLARGKVKAAELSLRFHCTVVEMVRNTCMEIARRTGLRRVVLSGGVWQNEWLLRGACETLEQTGFQVHVHRLVPANDGGVALGQAAIAGWRAR
ncbi:MAG TPA: carbamoyltransferase HypF [Solirubrobacteraceae bacterium]|jgi:hydrogenase maturation protein HypF